MHRTPPHAPNRSSPGNGPIGGPDHPRGRGPGPLSGRAGDARRTLRGSGNGPRSGPDRLPPGRRKQHPGQRRGLRGHAGPVGQPSGRHRACNRFGARLRAGRSRSGLGRPGRADRPGGPGRPGVPQRHPRPRGCLSDPERRRLRAGGLRHDSGRPGPGPRNRPPGPPESPGVRFSLSFQPLQARLEGALPGLGRRVPASLGWPADLALRRPDPPLRPGP